MTKKPKRKPMKQERIPPVDRKRDSEPRANKSHYRRITPMTSADRGTP